MNELKKREEGVMNEGGAFDVSDETAAAIAAAIVLHRSGPGSVVLLYEKGRHDEGFWGRSARPAMVAGWHTRRD